MKNLERRTQKIVILHSGGLSPRLLFSSFIRRHPELIAAVIQLPAIPSRKTSKSTLSFYKKILSSSFEYLVLNFLVVKLHDFIAFPFRKDLNSQASRLGIETAKFKSIDEKCLSKIKSLSPNYIFNASSFILKADVLDIPRFGTLNLHGAKLPEYRGAANYFWVLINNETQTQLTFHYVNTGLDTGEIIGYGDPVRITRSTTILGLWIQVRYSAFSLLERYVSLIETDQKIPSFKQDDALAVTRSFPLRSDVRRLPKNGFKLMSLSELLLFIRACFRSV